MSEEVEVETPVTQRKLSVEFGRSVSDGNYGSTSLKAYVQGEVGWDANEGDVAKVLATLASAAKIAVFDELGIVYFLDEETAILREETAAVPMNRLVQAVGGGTPVPTPVVASSGGRQSLPFTIVNFDDTSKQPVPDWAITKITAAGVGRVFDNRDTKTGKQPWFKEAVKRGEMNVSGTTDPYDALGFWPDK